MNAREKMCKYKVSFRTAGLAKKTADKYGQRVYECPICFCFHTTSKDDWKDDLLPQKQIQHIINQTTEIVRKEERKKLAQKLNNMRNQQRSMVAKNRNLAKVNATLNHEIQKLRKVVKCLQSQKSELNKPSDT